MSLAPTNSEIHAYCPPLVGALGCGQLGYDHSAGIRTDIEAISARDSVFSISPKAHTMYMYMAPEGPPLGSDQMSVNSTYCHTAPVTQAKPIRPRGPKYRCSAVRLEGPLNVGVSVDAVP